MIWSLFFLPKKKKQSLIPRILNISLATLSSSLLLCCDMCVWVYVCSHVWSRIYIFIFKHVETRVQYLVSSSTDLYIIVWDRVSHWTWISMIYLDWLISKPQGPCCLILPRIQITWVYHHTKCFKLELEVKSTH